MATGKMVQRGEAVGVVAAQSIGEPGTQLDAANLPRWRGIAGNISEENRIGSQVRVELPKWKTLKLLQERIQEGNEANIVISRTTELKLVDSKTRKLY